MVLYLGWIMSTRPKNFEFNDNNSWASELADRFSLIVDAAAYFEALREVLAKAEDQIFLIGWDFDFDIEMRPGESDEHGNAPDGLPNAIGPFLKALAKRTPSLQIYILQWSPAAVATAGKVLQKAKLLLSGPDQMHFALDGRHPIGACHHQKIVVVDDKLAFCGGIDVTEERWDTRDHAPDNDLRTLVNGEPTKPWHDASAAMTGPAARALGNLARRRWERSKNVRLPTPDTDNSDIWPDQLEVQFNDVKVAISRTEPPDEDTPVITEIEEMFLDMIAAAQSSIYIESQYFTADTVINALKARLAEPDGPEVVVVNPLKARVVLEDKVMHGPRDGVLKGLREADPHNRFRIYYPANSADTDIYVHAKLMIVDDILLRAGSANIDRRSMGFDTECDVTLFANTEDQRTKIQWIRNDLLAEHMATTVEKIEDAVQNTGSMLRTIDELNPKKGRRLCEIPTREHSLLDEALGQTDFFDPRYESGHKQRSGLTGRHWMSVILAGLAGFLLGRR